MWIVLADLQGQIAQAGIARVVIFLMVSQMFCDMDNMVGLQE